MITRNKELYAEDGNQAMDFAERWALEVECGFVGSEHLIGGIIVVGGIGKQVLYNTQVNIKSLVQRMQQVCHYTKTEVKNMEYTPRLKEILTHASAYAGRLGQKISTGHLLWGLVRNMHSVPAELLSEQVKLGDLEKEAEALLTTGKSSVPSLILDSTGRPFERK